MSDEECVVLAAEITLNPDPLTADGAPSFGFRSQTGVMPALGFECQLRSSGDEATPAWQSCQSPKAYSGLQDGAYTFSVRISGEDLADSYDFVVDKSPPKTVIIEVQSCLLHPLAFEWSVHIRPRSWQRSSSLRLIG